MRLLENIMVMSGNSPFVISEGTPIRSLDDYDEDDLKPEDDSKSTSELSKMVQDWIAKTKDKYFAAGIKQNTWDTIVDEVLQLISMLEKNDKEGISDRSIALKSYPLSDKIVNKVVSDLYSQVSSKLGSFEIRGSRILGDSLNRMFSVITESIEGSLSVIMD
jgi:hypothetical protein